METTYYLIDFYYSDQRELFFIERRKMFCDSDYELGILKSLCRKHCRSLFCFGFGKTPRDVSYSLSIVFEHQYHSTSCNLL